jgi:DNA repair exonuclease SbcCD ATPase subunit
MQNNQASVSQPSSPSSVPARERSEVEQGKWMDYLDAAIATKKSEKTIKRYVKKGALKWKRMGSQSNSPVYVWITPSFIESVSGEKEQKIEDPDIFEAESHEVDLLPNDAETSRSQAQPAHQETEELEDKNPVQKIIESFVKEFTVQLEKQQEVNRSLQKELAEKDAQLKLLPDLEKLQEKERQMLSQKTSLEEQVESLRMSMEKQQRIVDQLQLDVELRAKLAEELSKENEERLKIVQHLELEKEEKEKQASELAEENEKLCAEAEQLKTKPSLLNWLLGRKGS